MPGGGLGVQKSLYIYIYGYAYHIYVFMVQTSETDPPFLPYFPSTLKKKLRLSGDFFFFFFVILIFISPHCFIFSPCFEGLGFYFLCF